jgi:hypothetical protein
MKKIITTMGLAAFVFAGQAVAAEKGFEKIFDGKTLKGWNGNPKFWSVKDGAMTGQTTKENPTKGNTFIIWEGKTGDFDLRLDYKIIGGNSGIQYRSFKADGPDEWRIGGYQADFEAGDTYSGICYGERFRGILSLRGKKDDANSWGRRQVEERGRGICEGCRYRQGHQKGGLEQLPYRCA